MLTGIDNSFVLNDIFGMADIFKGAEIKNINWKFADSRIELEIQTSCKVINPPSKWNKWDCIYLRIALYGVDKLYIDLKTENIYISSLDIKENGSKYTINIYTKNKCCMKSEFEIARIQNIKPICLI